MDIKLELLLNHINDFLRNAFENFPPDTSKIADGIATLALDDIKSVLKNDELSDFDAIEQIVCIMENYRIDCGGRHDF